MPKTAHQGDCNRAAKVLKINGGVISKGARPPTCQAFRSHRLQHRNPALKPAFNSKKIPDGKQKTLADSVALNEIERGKTASNKLLNDNSEL
jgi:hypothetical protein